MKIESLIKLWYAVAGVGIFIWMPIVALFMNRLFYYCKDDPMSFVLEISITVMELLFYAPIYIYCIYCYLVEIGFLKKKGKDVSK